GPAAGPGPMLRVVAVEGFFKEEVALLSRAEHRTGRVPPTTAAAPRAKSASMAASSWDSRGPRMVVPPRKLLSLSCLAAALLIAGCERRAPAPGRPRLPRLEVRREIADILESGSASLLSADTVGSGAAWTHTLELYDQRHHRPAWSEDGHLGPRVAELIE